eukprot:6491136-Amphidinium_carterae.2
MWQGRDGISCQAGSHYVWCNWSKYVSLWRTSVMCVREGEFIALVDEIEVDVGWLNLTTCAATGRSTCRCGGRQQAGGAQMFKPRMVRTHQMFGPRMMQQVWNEVDWRGRAGDVSVDNGVKACWWDRDTARWTRLFLS